MVWCGFRRCGIEVLVRFQLKTYVRPIALVVVSTRLHMCMHTRHRTGIQKKESSQVQRYFTITHTNHTVAIELMQRMLPNNEYVYVQLHCCSKQWTKTRRSLHEYNFWSDLSFNANNNMQHVFHDEFHSLADSHTVITMDGLSLNRTIWKLYGESLLIAWNTFEIIISTVVR